MYREAPDSCPFAPILKALPEASEEQVEEVKKILYPLVTVESSPYDEEAIECVKQKMNEMVTNPDKKDNACNGIAELLSMFNDWRGK